MRQNKSKREAIDMFPVTSSILSAEALLQQVISDYAFDDLLDCQLIRRRLSDTYLVQSVTKPYILRVYRPTWRSLSEILYEMDMLTYLHHNGASISTPIESKDGSFVHGLHAPEGMRYMALF